MKAETFELAKKFLGKFVEVSVPHRTNSDKDWVYYGTLYDIDILKQTIEIVNAKGMLAIPWDDVIKIIEVEER